MKASELLLEQFRQLKSSYTGDFLNNENTNYKFRFDQISCINEPFTINESEYEGTFDSKFREKLVLAGMLNKKHFKTEESILSGQSSYS